jgi:cytochrome c biogenesis protein
MVHTLSTAPSRDRPPEPRPPAMRPIELARWGWRQLTSMRTALVLLFLLALAAVPGSLVPQRSISAARAAQFAQQHPHLDPWYQRFSLYAVYSSPWFAAIYLLLFISLVGCVVPRSRQHLAASLARPPRAPRHLDRLPAHVAVPVPGTVPEVLDRARTALRGRRFRVDVAGDHVAAEKGYLRETGNLLFHLALLLLLLSVALGHLFGYKANVLLVEGTSFSNTVSTYDTWTPGALADEAKLAPFTVTLKHLAVRFQRGGQQSGAPRDFQGALRYTTDPAARPRSYDLRVNHPLVVDGVKVFLLGNGYAPVITVRDSHGQVVLKGPVPFLTQDGNFTSNGVVKVPGASPQLGFQGFFLPTAAFDPTRGPVSVYPGLELPRLVLTAWRGDLGIDGGAAQSVYTLDTSGMSQVLNSTGKPFARSLARGQTMTLPTGETVTFDGIRRWASLAVARDPGTTPALLSALLALAGLMLSLFVRRRRVWVRVSDEGGRTLLEVAGLARAEGDEGLPDEVRELAGSIAGTDPPELDEDASRETDDASDRTGAPRER